MGRNASNLIHLASYRPLNTGNVPDQGYLSFLERIRNLPQGLLARVIAAESGGNPNAVSSAGAMGMMQLMPGTARRFGVANPFDARENERGGADYLARLLNMFHGNVAQALAGYNAGEGTVANALRRYGERWFSRMPAETQNYVNRIMRGYNHYGASPGGQVINNNNQSVGPTTVTISGVSDPQRAARLVSEKLDRTQANAQRYMRGTYRRPGQTAS